MSGGTLYLNGADVHDNAAAGAAGRGGAIFASGGAVVTLTNSSFIGESGPCCNVAYDGGGIYADGSRIYSLGGNSTILQNAAANNGGGLYLVNGSLFSALSGTNVGYDAQPPNGNTAVLGAGMYVHSSTVELAGRIINNTASNSGGGMYAVNSVVTLTNAAVGGTGTNLPNKITATGLNGAGLYLMDGTRAHLSNTLVTSNTLQNVNSGYGAGLYVRAGSSVTLTNSRLERNWAPSAFDGRGAGVYLYDGTLRLDNSQVLTNTAANLGGGMRLFGTSVLFVANGSSLNANAAGNALGGALAATGTPAIALSDSTMHNNTAATNGGAVYLDAGTLQVYRLVGLPVQPGRRKRRGHRRARHGQRRHVGDGGRAAQLPGGEPRRRKRRRSPPGERQQHGTARDERFSAQPEHQRGDQRRGRLRRRRRVP